jgi:cytochrome c553
MDNYSPLSSKTKWSENKFNRKSTLQNSEGQYRVIGNIGKTNKAKHSTICVACHHMQTNTNNVNEI